MGFNDWINIQPTGFRLEDHADEWAQLAHEKLAQRLQTSLRSRVDPGINAEDANRAQAVRVKAEGNRLVISEESQGKVLQAAAATVAPARPGASLDDLFTSSLGPPEIIDIDGGGQGVAFRVLKEDQVFNTVQADRDDAVERVMTDTLRAGIVEAYEEAAGEIAGRYPRNR